MTQTLSFNWSTISPCIVRFHCQGQLVRQTYRHPGLKKGNEICHHALTIPIHSYVTSLPGITIRKRRIINSPGHQSPERFIPTVKSPLKVNEKVLLVYEIMTSQVSVFYYHRQANCNEDKKSMSTWASQHWLIAFFSLTAGIWILLLQTRRETNNAKWTIIVPRKLVRDLSYIPQFFLLHGSGCLRSCDNYW